MTNKDHEDVILFEKFSAVRHRSLLLRILTKTSPKATETWHFDPFFKFLYSYAKSLKNENAVFSVENERKNLSR